MIRHQGQVIPLQMLSTLDGVSVRKLDKSLHLNCLLTPFTLL